MNKKASPMFIKVITPLHAGGESRLSIIDLPIQREGHNDFPKIEASTLKGCIRNAVEKYPNEKIGSDMINIIFGADGQDNTPDSEKNTITASAIAFSDARILFFPVRSVKGVFAYVTCPYALNRFVDDMNLTHLSLKSNPIDYSELKSENCFTAEKFSTEEKENASSVAFPSDKKNTVMLDEYAFDAEYNQAVSDLMNEIVELLPKTSNSKQLKKQVVVVSDDDFTDFVKNSTEVITRIKIDNTTGIVKEGALFNEEYLPSESILYSLIFVSDEHKADNISKKADDIKANLNNALPEIIQIGANMTLGKGFTKCKIIWEGDKNA
jgi:CRISPR-associated protein Cmr4